MRSRDSFVIASFAVAALICGCRGKQEAAGDDFLRLSNVGKAQLDRGDAAKAITTFESALKLNPAHPDAKLNLANALLLANRPADALALARSVIDQDHTSAAACYIAGVAENRQRHFPEAVKQLTEAKQIDVTVNAVSMQLGLAYEGMTNYDAAIDQYEEVEKFAPDYPGIHYRLSQMYLRRDRAADANREMELHRDWLAKHPNEGLNETALERCKYTQARVPFTLEQPDPTGIRVQFADMTGTALPGNFSGPVGTIDFAHDGRNHLLVRDGDSFRVLLNEGGRFRTNGQSFPFTNGGTYSRWLVADLNKDGVPDALVLGDRGVHLYRFTTNGAATETTGFSGLKNFAARDGIFADLNFRSDLDIVATGTNGELRVMSNLQNMYFVDTTTNLPAMGQVSGFAFDDWNNDEVQDLFVGRDAGSPALWLHQRGGGFTNAAIPLPSGRAFAVADLNNDLRPDIIVAAGANLEITFGGDEKLHAIIPLAGFQPRELKLVDYDNDGWLDVIAIGDGLRAWRNLGAKGFVDATSNIGLDKVSGTIQSLVAADFDGDGDIDLVIGTAAGLRLLRNDGGNANHQVKLSLRGTRSNSSAFGTRIDISAAGLRLSRRITALPIEIGVGKHERVDAVTAQWLELTTTQEDVPAKPAPILTLLEPMINTGSCPFLYAWDGRRFRFVTDILGSAPLGLPIAPGKYIEADTEEMVWLGNDSNFKPRNGRYVVQLTEELREVLYLDQVKLVVADHLPGTEVHTTDKMIARRPAGGYARGQVVTLENPHPLRHAFNDRGEDVAPLLREADGRLASPQIREPQYRGLAEPHSVTLDFGPLDPSKPLVLALTGWLRFGGATANIAASSRPDFPFPFPVIEAEVSTGSAATWRRVDLEPAAPSGKTKTIVFDLSKKLPSGTQRLRVTAAFEIHWDRIALLEKAVDRPASVTLVTPTMTHLHWRGYSEYADLPWNQPITPVYEKLRTRASWRVTPSGWATRYGEVNELVQDLDDALAMIAGGDELTVEFAVANLPAKPDGMIRDYFLFTSGWDKDSDYHVATGTSIEPIPWHGLDDQRYGKQPRPSFTNYAWIAKYNTRWIGPKIVSRVNSSSESKRNHE